MSPETKAALLTPHNGVWWRLIADEIAMQEAEHAVLGDYTYHRSQLDWAPMDEDDERPDRCDRYIEWRSGDSEAFAAAMKVAGHLGERCSLDVFFSAPAVHIHVTSRDGDVRARSSLFPAALDQAVVSRINKAIATLQGDEP
jgi:hypothetical protein